MRDRLEADRLLPVVKLGLEQPESDRVKAEERFGHEAEEVSKDDHGPRGHKNRLEPAQPGQHPGETRKALPLLADERRQAISPDRTDSEPGDQEGQLIPRDSDQSVEPELKAEERGANQCCPGDDGGSRRRVE